MFASRLGFKGEALSPDIRKKQAEKLRESFVIFPVRLWKLRAHSHEGLSEDEVSYYWLTGGGGGSNFCLYRY